MNFSGFVRKWGKKAVDFVMGEPFYPVADMPRSIAELTGSAGNGLDANVIMAPIFWIMRTFTESRAIVERRRDTVWEDVEDHPLEILIDKPNDFYDADALWKATVLSYCLDGNAYWQKVRNVIGEVLELWYIPHWLIRPKWNELGTEYIGYYEYNPTGREPLRLPPRDVVHFRFGMDPRNTRIGLAPLKTLIPEYTTDVEAALFSAAILRNHGMPGLLVSPKDPGKVWTATQSNELKQQMTESFTGDKRGSTMVMSQPTDVAQFGFDPNKLMLPNLRDISEERVCAVFGVPAAVVGFGSGLQSTKVGATMRELVRLAWNTCLNPMQKSMAKTLTTSLLPDFVSQTRRFRAYFDTTEASVFVEDELAKSQMIGQQVRDGIHRVDRAQQALGLEVDPTQAVYLRPTTSVAIDENGDPVEPPKPPPDPNALPDAIAGRMNGAPANGNGTTPNEAP